MSESEPELSATTLLSLHRTMLRLRLVEERVAGLITSEPGIVCPVHLYTGQEAVAAGVCAHLTREDYVFSTHRSHGHFLAKGGSLNGLLAELFGRETGCSHGRGGSMHLADIENGLPGSSAIVAGTIPLAVGAALALKTQGTTNLAVAFFGDGATNEGAFYESLNLASLLKLPVIFVCENNLYSTHMPADECLADTDISKKASIFAMPGYKVDGNDVVEVYRVAATAVGRARSSGGPALIECLTYRWRGHVGPNYDVDKGLRSQAELDHWKQRCPIKRIEEGMIKDSIISAEEIAAASTEIEAEIEAALQYALNSPLPEPENLLNNVYSG